MLSQTVSSVEPVNDTEDPALRFIGSKQRLVASIGAAISESVGPGEWTAADLFCGSAAVARHFKQLGFRVIANDNLYFCSLMAETVLRIKQSLLFSRLARTGLVSFNACGCRRYRQVIEILNSLSGYRGFLYSEYSPGGTARGEFERKYFTNENAQKIDAIRLQIRQWSATDVIDPSEEALLIVDLIRAANRVANIAGTYGCFLKDWDMRARRSLTLVPSKIDSIGLTGEHEVYYDDAFKLLDKVKCDILYLDPPYTWRHYGAYYHILETIAKYDEPQVSGKTGLRPWHSTRSPFCSRDEALSSLEALLRRIRVSHVFLSYNSEGLIAHRDILNLLAELGPVKSWSFPYRRYRSSPNGRTHGAVKERLYHVEVK